MKKILFLLISVIACTQLSAQSTSHCCKPNETLRQKKVAFLTSQANLTDEEAAKFFPLYFELHKRQNQLRKNIWKSMHNEQNSDLSEADYATMLNQYTESEHLSHELEQVYMEKYKAFLSSKKIYKLMKADILFNRRLIKAHSNHKAKILTDK